MTLPLPTDGTYTLTFGVGNANGDLSRASALLIDNVQRVPEPAPFALLGLAFAAMALARLAKPR